MSLVADDIYKEKDTGRHIIIIVYSLKKTSDNQNEINNYLSELSLQIKNVNNHSASLEEKLSSFLSTQLNTQSTILQLINQINEKGILDSSTKKI